MDYYVVFQNGTGVDYAMTYKVSNILLSVKRAGYAILGKLWSNLYFKIQTYISIIVGKMYTKILPLIIFFFLFPYML